MIHPNPRPPEPTKARTIRSLAPTQDDALNNEFTPKPIPAVAKTPLLIKFRLSMILFFIKVQQIVNCIEHQVAETFDFPVVPMSERSIDGVIAIDPEDGFIGNVRIAAQKQYGCFVRAKWAILV
jgi:hypothetical protein